jgi:hypothetical protein
MGRPTYDDETLAGYFQPVHEALFDDPEVGPLLRRLRVEDPDIILAVADVDRSQIRDCIDRSAARRVLCAVTNWNGIARYRRVG